MADKGKKKSSGENAPIKLHPTSKRQSNYEGSKQKNKFCPKCGPGIMMANHQNRVYCGKCQYMEKK